MSPMNFKTILQALEEGKGVGRKIFIGVGEQRKKDRKIAKKPSKLHY